MTGELGISGHGGRGGRGGRGMLGAVLVRVGLMLLGTAIVALGVATQVSAHTTPAKKGRPDLAIAAAIGSDGRLWVVTKENGEQGDYLYLKHSRDDGKNWSKPVRINPVPEPIMASGEEPPQLLLQAGGKMLVGWTRPGKKYAGDIRSAISTDGGETWAAPITVHQDSQPLAHRQLALASDQAGRAYAVWIDRRHVEGKGAVPKYRGATLYYAVSDDGGAHWRGDYRLVDHACDCCRLALLNAEPGASGPQLFWRHVFENGVRDHALLRLAPEGKVGTIRRATFDEWKIDACPDHGPALASTGAVRHAVWFTVKGEASQVFYGRLPTGEREGKSVEGQTALPDGAEHPAIVAKGERVWLVWKYFDGKASRIGGWMSKDGGKNWQRSDLAATKQASDYPRLLLHDDQAILVWHTQQDGLIVRRLEEGS